jgi:hypothetical protein
VDFAFVADILVVFRTTIVGLDGDENTDQKYIAKEYLKGSFVIDLLSTVPFDSLAEYFVASSAASNLSILGFLKMIRVTRLTRMIQGLSVDRSIKGYLKLSKLMFMLCLYVHCIGCLWFLLNKQQMTWIPPADAIFKGA